MTLAPTNAVASEPFIATYTINVKNQSTTDAVYNATVADQVPAELGVVVGSISNGGTYDAIKHAITWNFTNDPSLKTFEANGVRNYTFQVYARQKPGYKFQPDAAHAWFHHSAGQRHQRRAVQRSVPRYRRRADQRHHRVVLPAEQHLR